MIACLEAFSFADLRWNYVLQLCTVERRSVTGKVLADAQLKVAWIEKFSGCPGRECPRNGWRFRRSNQFDKSSFKKYAWIDLRDFGVKKWGENAHRSTHV